MIKSGFGEWAERIGIKLGIAFSRVPLTPNQWTVLSVLPAIAGFVSLAIYKRMDWALAAFLLSALMDGIDGGVARVTGRVSNLGAYLDGIVDRIVEGFLLFGLLFFGLADFDYAGIRMPMAPWIVLLLFVGSALVSYARAYADHRKVLTDQKALRRMPSILERAERLVLIFAGMAGWFYNPQLLNGAIVLAALLSVITFLQRIFYVVQNAE